jgi:hypothetical protein
VVVAAEVGADDQEQLHGCGAEGGDGEDAEGLGGGGQVVAGQCGETGQDGTGEGQ